MSTWPAIANDIGTAADVRARPGTLRALTRQGRWLALVGVALVAKRIMLLGSLCHVGLVANVISALAVVLTFAAQRINPFRIATALDAWEASRTTLW